MNGYCRSAEITRDMGLRAGDARIPDFARLIDQASRAVDRELDPRHFYSEVATRYYPDSGDKANGGWGGEKARELWLGDDLLSVTTIKASRTSAGAYSYTLVADTDYWLWPYNKSPKRMVELNWQGGQIGVWPPGPRQVQIVGTFGYSYDVEACGTLAAELDASATTFALADDHAACLTDTLVIGTEQIAIGDLEGDTITGATRGLNGTTAAIHLVNAPVSFRRFPRDLELAMALDVARLWRDKQTGAAGSAGSPEMGYSFSATYPKIAEILDNLRPRSV